MTLNLSLSCTISGLLPKKKVNHIFFSSNVFEMIREIMKIELLMKSEYDIDIL